MSQQTELPLWNQPAPAAKTDAGPDCAESSGSTLSPVTLEISFEALLGKRATDMSETVRQKRWEAWKKLAPEVAEYWQPEGCEGCRHLRGDWCSLQELPAAVNPILSYRQGMPGMACMGAGYESNK
jgi:hypothetical protein